MAKKAAAPKLQEDIQTDEELYIFLERPGLLVLDIYSEWCGPCLGMVGSLRKLKLELGGDNLSYAICKADTIDMFKRFRRKSEPTWLFVTNYKAVNIMFGSNVPKLMTLICSELRLLELETRNFYELNENLPEELRRRQIIEENLNQSLALELEQKERERLNNLSKVTDTIMENLPDMGVTIFGPQVNRDFMKDILKKAEQLRIQLKERKLVQITREHFKTIHFNCSNPISDDILEQLEGKELIVCCWKVMGNGSEVPKLLQQFAKELQISQVRYADNGDEVVVPALLDYQDLEVKEDIEDYNSWSNKSEEILSRPQKSVELYNEFEEDEKSLAEEDNISKVGLDFELEILNEQLVEKEMDNIEDLPKNKASKKIRVPPIWVADNQRTHAALIYTYFRSHTETFLPPDPKPEPPYVIMAFDAYKKRDLILHAERYKLDVPMYGFFTSDDADEAKYIANSLENYKSVTNNDKIVLKVKKTTSYTMLQLVTYGPSYVSPNPLIGQEEAMKFFPPTYKTADQEHTEEDKLLKDHSTLQRLDKNTKKKKILDKHSIIEDTKVAVQNPVEAA